MSTTWALVNPRVVHWSGSGKICMHAASGKRRSRGAPAPAAFVGVFCQQFFLGWRFINTSCWLTAAGFPGQWNMKCTHVAHTGCCGLGFKSLDGQRRTFNWSLNNWMLTSLIVATQQRPPASCTWNAKVCLIAQGVA